MDTVKAYYFDIFDLLRHGNGVEVHHHMTLEEGHVLGVEKITASIYINQSVLKDDNELFVLEADGFEDKPESLMVLISNNQTTLLNAVDRIIETGASVAIAKVETPTVVAKVEEVGNGTNEQNHNDDTDAVLDHPVADDTSGDHQDLASDLGSDLPPNQCQILGIRKYFEVEDSKGVDIVLNPIDGDEVTEEEYTQVKAKIEELIAETKKDCKRSSFIVVDITDSSKGNNYVYYVTVKPTTEDEAKAADTFYRKMMELSLTHDNIINLSSIFTV